ncbi:MAG: hypothetical protein DMG70_05485, partial [Acidobacteria bacterium]
PHSEFCDINEVQDPAGASHYNALDVNYTHRVSQGLTMLASYTFSKFIDNVGGPENWASASANFSENIRNVYNLAAEKSVDATDTPHSFVLSYIYELPVGKNKKFGAGMNGVLYTVVGNWQTSGTLTLKQGFPLTITSVGNGLNYFGAGQHVDVVGDYHVAHPSRTQWFNTSAFAIAQPWSSALLLGSARTRLQNLGLEYPKVLPDRRAVPVPVSSGYVQRAQSHQLLQSEYVYGFGIWDDHSSVGPEANAGSP